MDKDDPFAAELSRFLEDNEKLIETGNIELLPMTYREKIELYSITRLFQYDERFRIFMKMCLNLHRATENDDIGDTFAERFSDLYMSTMGAWFKTLKK